MSLKKNKNEEKEVDEVKTNELNDEKETDEVKSEVVQEKVKTDADKYLDQLQRTMAEFDNYKKRTAKEKEEFYNLAIIEIMSKFLPVIDNLENALNVIKDSDDSVKEGVNLILKQFKDVLKSFGVEEIEAIGTQFNPELHEAVMHISDENYGENEVVEVFRKGYMCKDKVLRYTMVKVAN